MINKKVLNNVFNFLSLQFVFILYSLAGLFAKFASMYDFENYKFYVCYIVELILIAIYAMLWQNIIKNNNLVFAYVNKGIVVVWMLVWAMLFFGETIKANNIVGAIIIMIGIGSVGLDEH